MTTPITVMDILNLMKKKTPTLGLVAAALQENITDETLNFLAKNGKKSVRAAIPTREFSTPVNVLKTLSQDEDYDVRYLAVKKLRQMGEFDDWPEEWLESNFALKNVSRMVL